MKINFYPDSDRQDFMPAVLEYESVWKKYAKQIVEAWQRITGLKFRETEINAIVYESRSQSHPFLLRASIDTERKTTVLIHELGHRIIFKRQNIPEFNTLESHKTLFLVLYEVFVEVLGEEIADRAVKWDKEKLSPEVYGVAWDWALSFSKEERIKKFQKRIVFTPET